MKFVSFLSETWEWDIKKMKSILCCIKLVICMRTFLFLLHVCYNVDLLLISYFYDDKKISDFYHKNLFFYFYLFLYFSLLRFKDVDVNALLEWIFKWVWFKWSDRLKILFHFVLKFEFKIGIIRACECCEIRQ